MEIPARGYGNVGDDDRYEASQKDSQQLHDGDLPAGNVPRQGRNMPRQGRNMPGCRLSLSAPFDVKIFTFNPLYGTLKERLGAFV